MNRLPKSIIEKMDSIYFKNKNSFKNHNEFLKLMWMCNYLYNKGCSYPCKEHFYNDIVSKWEKSEWFWKKELNETEQEWSTKFDKEQIKELRVKKKEALYRYIKDAVDLELISVKRIPMFKGGCREELYLNIPKFQKIYLQYLSNYYKVNPESPWYEGIQNLLYNKDGFKGVNNFTKKVNKLKHLYSYIKDKVTKKKPTVSDDKSKKTIVTYSFVRYFPETEKKKEQLKPSNEKVEISNSDIIKELKRLNYENFKKSRRYNKKLYAEMLEVIGKLK